LSARRPPRTTPFPYTTLFRSWSSSMEKKRKKTTRDWIEADPELQAILEDEEYEGLFYERVKQGYRAWRERQARERERLARLERRDRKSTRLNSSHRTISYAVF